MADEKKLTNEEITDEKANEAAGGFLISEFKCEGGCGRTYSGRAPASINGKPCCSNCYAKYLEKERPQRRP